MHGTGQDANSDIGVEEANVGANREPAYTVERINNVFESESAETDPEDGKGGENSDESVGEIDNQPKDSSFTSTKLVIEELTASIQVGLSSQLKRKHESCEYDSIDDEDDWRCKKI